MLAQQQLKEANEKLLKQMRKGGKSKNARLSREAKIKPCQQGIYEALKSLEIAEKDLFETLSTIIASIILKESFEISEYEDN